MAFRWPKCWKDGSRYNILVKFSLISKQLNSHLYSGVKNEMATYWRLWNYKLHITRKCMTILAVRAFRIVLKGWLTICTYNGWNLVSTQCLEHKDNWVGSNILPSIPESFPEHNASATCTRHKAYQHWSCCVVVYQSFPLPRDPQGTVGLQGRLGISIRELTAT